MKNILKAVIGFVGAALMFTSCFPDSPELGAITLTGDDLDISVTQNPEKDNTVYLENKTPGIIPFWDYKMGFTNLNKTEVNIVYAGEYDITFTAFTREGSVSTVRKVTVSQNDEDYFADPMWNLLTDGAAGKTWVWDYDASAVYGNGGFGSVRPEWWQVSLNDTGTIKERGEMTFALDGAQIFSKTPDGGAATQTGSFTMDVDKKQLAIQGSNIIFGADYSTDGADGNFYYIRVLTETELVLARGNASAGWQNTWMFKVKK